MDGMTAEIGDFYSLSPNRVLEAVDAGGARTTGLCYALNSLENRVYEVELEDGPRQVAKFYRPGRWSKETILDEHELLLTLVEHDIPVCAPIRFADGRTLQTTPEGIRYALFPKASGRCPDEILDGEYEQIGALMARIHNIASALVGPNRPAINAKVYGTQALEALSTSGFLSDIMFDKYRSAVHTVVDRYEALSAHKEVFWIHGDCHRANLMRGANGWFVMDFDDSGHGLAVQDLWLLLPSRPKDCPRECEAMLLGYEQFRNFNYAEWTVVEALRALRYVRYAAWIATRYADPSFKNTFPDFGSEHYWQQQINDLYEQIACLDEAAQDPWNL